MSRPSGLSQPRAQPPAVSTFELSPAWCWLLVAVAVLVAYWPALSGGFLWDDDGHVTRADLRSLSGLARIWFEPGATQQYYPLLHSAFWIEHHLWGDAPRCYHLLSILLHAANACLFATLLRRLAVPGAWFAALLFALHPVGVESVAWIAEQKNTLSALLYLGAALVYLRFDRDRRPRSYAFALTLFVAALLTKTVTATLPAALLVIFWWQRGSLSWRRDVVPLLPWFALGAASGLFTAHFERALIGANGTDFNFSVADRLVIAGRVVWFYFGKLVWPANLAFIYPRWSIDPASVVQWLGFVAALLLLAAVFVYRQRSRAPLAAVLLFAGTLFPVLGFFNVYPFVFSFVADHFQYLACLALFALAAAALTSRFSRFPRPARIVSATSVLLLLGGLTWSQASTYHDEFALYESTLICNPSAWMAHNNLAITLTNSGRVREAIPHLEQALKLRPDYPEALNNLGDDYIRIEQPATAIPLLEKAIRLQPTYAVAHRNLGRALATIGRTPEAIPHFSTAARLNPSDPDAELSWGVGLMLTDRFDEAIPHFERACKLDVSPNAHLIFGRALLDQRKFEEAAQQFRAVLELDDGSAEAHLNLGLALRSLDRNDEANQHFLVARQLEGPK